MNRVKLIPSNTFSLRLYLSILKCIVSILCFFSLYFIHEFIFKPFGESYIIGAFGAVIILLFAEKRNDFSVLQILTSSIITATLGVFFSRLEFSLSLKIALVIGGSIFILNSFKTNYPPAGAIALIPVLGGTAIQELGYLYVIYPTITGTIIILVFSLLHKRCVKYVRGMLKATS